MAGNKDLLSFSEYAKIKAQAAKMNIPLSGAVMQFDDTKLTYKEAYEYIYPAIKQILEYTNAYGSAALDSVSALVTQMYQKGLLSKEDIQELNKNIRGAEVEKDDK